MRQAVLAAAIALGMLVRPVSTQPAVLDLPNLLDRYAAGRFDEAITAVKNAPDVQARAIRAAFMGSGRLWIDAPGHSPAERALTAAAFALETEWLRAERGDWAAPGDAFCAGRCVIEWACALLFERTESAGAFEHDWFLASIALSSGVRDWAFLHALKSGAEVFSDTGSHADHALRRFPGDSRFRLARAQAIAARFETTIEQDEPHEGTRLVFPASSMPSIIVNGRPIGPGGGPLSAAASRRALLRGSVLSELLTLSSDPGVGAQARIRVANLQWAGGDYDAALENAEKAAADTADPDLRYLALFVAGRTAQSSGRLTKAESLFAAALQARPHSQSATIALSALLFQRGDAAAAYALTEASFANRKNDDDPWRLFQYGDYAKLPGMIQALRQRIAAMGAK